jgi:hypothetical protein
MLRPRIALLLAVLTLTLAVPVTAAPLLPGAPSQPRLVVFEAFMRST